MLKKYNCLKKFLSIVIIISMVFNSVTFANFFQNDTKYVFAPELEIDDNYVDDGMFYMPHDCLEVNENGDIKKYVVKIKRKGSAETNQKVKLSMIDITGSYGRDYSIKVINKGLFIENVENKDLSKSIDEYMSSSDYEEYNNSDAIVDGYLTDENLMSEEEVENFTMSEDEQKELIDDASIALDELSFGGSSDETDEEVSKENNYGEDLKQEDAESEDLKQEDKEIDIQNGDLEEDATEEDLAINDVEKEANEDNANEETISEDANIENIDNENVNDKQDETINESNDDTKNETEHKAKQKIEEEPEETTKDETRVDKENEQTENETTVLEDTKSKENNYGLASKSTANAEEEVETAETKKRLEIKIASMSSIEYADDPVKFDIQKATMSIVEGFEMATGLKDDKKTVKPKRSLETFGVNPNSINDISYMREGIKAVEEGLKSAYVILDFKEGQSEKLIEVSILNDDTYRGNRQVGFNLFDVDGSDVSGMYSSMTLIIHDDEEEVPTYIDFTKTVYEPDNGYIEVEIERSGELSNVATCMLDSEDISAKAARDYSQVHTQLVFGLGVNKRRIKIPVVSSFISKSASFKLKLQEAKGALLGEKNEATCVIKNTDTSFKYAYGNNLDAASNDEELSGDISDVDLFGAGGKDYDMDSIYAGQEMDFQKKMYEVNKKNANSNSNYSVINSGKGVKFYLENHDFFGESAYYTFTLSPPKYYSHPEYNGIQIKWSIDSSNNDVTIKNYLESNRQWEEVAHKKGDTWKDRTDNFFFNSGVLSHLWFCLFRYDGAWRTSPTLTIDSIKPIYKMFKINLEASKVPALVDDQGQTTSNNKYAKYAVTSIDGAKSDGSAVGWYGRTITVKLDNNINNPFYIKALYYKYNDYQYKLATNNNQNASTLSFEMNDGFFNRMKSYYKTINRQGGGKNGEFTIYAELAAKDSVVKIEKDKRVDVNIWYEAPASSTETANVYNYHVGDVMHFVANINPGYEDTFQCDGLNVYRIKPYSSEWITIRRPLTGEDYFPLDAEYSEIKVVPIVSQKNNAIVVRIKEDDVSKFDEAYGLFANNQSFEKDGYMEYYVERDSTKIPGRYFEIKARCKDSNNVPVWLEANKPSVKVAQNTYYFLGSEVYTDNVIYLSAEQADDIEYSVVGTAYYEETPIGGKIVDKYWQVAPYIAVVVDDTHFAYSDAKGAFATFPAKAKAGYYNQLKIVSNGDAKYLKVKLNNNKKVTKTYTITYDSGDKEMTKESYEVPINEILISNSQKNHPYTTAVKSLNSAGTAFSAVYINDDTTSLIAYVQAKQPDGSDFTYTYINEIGAVQTAVESVKRVEFVVIDKSDYSVKKVIEATGNSDKTEWTVDFKFERGHYAEYMSGDKLYVRIVTDKKVGDGKGYDISGNERASIPIFNETTYQSISTTYPFIESAEKQPNIINMDLGADKEGALKLPVIGTMSTSLNAMGMVFSVKPEGEKVRIGIGKKFKGKGNRYDGNGKKVSDTGSAINLSNFKEGFSEMANLIKSSGTKRLKTMTLGIPTWTIEPTIGASFDFMLYHDPKAKVKDRYEFVGGSGYFGCVIDLRYTFYFLVWGFPCYVGGQVMITIVAEFGLAVDKNTHIPFNDPDQGFFDGLIHDTHFDFLIKATLDGSAYVGGGIAGTAGVRGGFQLLLKFIYNPSVKHNYDNVRPVGFSATGNIRIWIDAVLMHFSIPVYKWLNPKNFGYFEDLDNIKNKKTYGSDKLNFKDVEIIPKPRPSEISEFVANENSYDNLFGAGYAEEVTKTLITDVYDIAEPQIIKYDNNKALLVYLDDDKNNPDVDRTVLRYMLYDYTNPYPNDSWTEPKNISNDKTADFAPTVCDVGDKILVSWCSRYETAQDDKNYKELIEKMEIYAVFFDKATATFGDIERLTIDNGYDYYPKAVYDKADDRIYLYYLKDLDINEITNAEEFLDAIQPEVNGSYLMYMIYDDPTNTGEKHWVRDFYYDYELQSGISEEDKQQFINTWKGQRFQNLSVTFEEDTEVINNPNISEFEVFFDTILDMTDEEIEDFLVSKGYASIEDVPESEVDALSDEFNTTYADRYKNQKAVCFVVEKDGNLESKEDTEIFLKLDTMDNSEPKTIRLTYNSVSDMMPKIIQSEHETYLLWIQNESMIKMVALDNIIAKATKEEHETKSIETGSAYIETIDNVILSDKLHSYQPFVDSENNLFIVWQQNSADSFEVDANGEIEFKQDLYMAGLINSINNNGDEVVTWSNPLRLTNNEKLNELPTVLDMGEKLLFVNNQYNLKSSSEIYNVSNSNLQQIIYKPVSSLNVVDIIKTFVRQDDNDSVEYDIQFIIQNSGQIAAEGYEYSGSVTYGNETISTFGGESDEFVLPGGSTRIGGMSMNSDLDFETPSISLILTSEQAKNLDDVKLNFNIVEKNMSDAGVNLECDLFDIKQEYKISDLEDDEDKEGYVTVEHEGDEFVIKGILTNSGYSASKGNEKIYIIKQDNWDKPIASSDYIDLDIGEQTQFVMTIADNVLYGTEYGYEDLVVFVKNDKGDVLSEYVLATVNSDCPYNFKVNGQTEKIQVKLGKSINLNTTYEPSERFVNASIIYTTNDYEIAHVVDDKLYGVNLGTTVLDLSAAEYGGHKTIQVEVVPDTDDDNKRRGSSDGGDSSGGGSGAGPIPNTTQNVQTTKVATAKYVPVVLDSKQITWVYDPIDNKFRMNINIANMSLPVTNGFYSINERYDYTINGINIKKDEINTYYFDANGNMITGFVQTVDNKVYLFEYEKNSREGQMVTGWRFANGNWYYFSEDGSMLMNSMTPDGYFVDESGRWKKQ